MSLFRSTRCVLSMTRHRFTLPTQQQRFATQDYGSGTGNPAGENPQKQGKSQVSRDLEHPGPEAPSVGQKGGSSSGNDQKDDRINTKSNRQQEQEQLERKNEQAQGTNGGPKPKILNESPPKEGEESEDVKKHNEEMDQRADRPNEKVRDEDIQKDKVGKQYWKGTGGVDRDP